MPDIIKLLPEHVANQIAAGEVVQRPASVVKELVDNAIDAGASSVKIAVKDAGKTLIQVIDDGKGMTAADARMSFMRHATSKLRLADDLLSILTMGFRGEALPSIGAVSQILLKTRSVDDELGTEISFEAGELKQQIAFIGQPGTQISVKNLFFNIPARRAFLKNNIIEFRHITEEFQRQSLAHPHVFFSLSHEGQEVYHLPAGSLRQRIIHLFGNSYDERLIPVKESTGVMEVTGYAGKPEFARKTRGEQFFFLNTRFIKDPYFHHAVMKAYEEMLPAESIPFYSLHLTVPPDKIDVNVHPAKTEVKFKDEKTLYLILQAAVRKALGHYILSPSIDFDAETAFSSLDLFSPAAINEPVIRVDPTYNPFEQQKPLAVYESLQPQTARAPAFFTSAESHDETTGWRERYTMQDAKPAGLALYTSESELVPKAGELTERTAFQTGLGYLVTPVKSGMLVIEQQAAHERILYEQYMDLMDHQTVSSQQTLFPQTIHLNAADHSLLRDLKTEVQLLGFDLREFGGNTWVLEGVPAGLPPGNEQGIIEVLLENYKENFNHHSYEKKENLARSLARKASIKAARKLEFREINLIIDQLFACKVPSVSPSGKNVFITVTLDELRKKFEK